MAGMVLCSLEGEPLGLAVLVVLVGLGLSLRAERKRRLMEDTPLSKALGVFIGEVALEGVCYLEKPLVAPLSGQPCVRYTWSVSEHWEREEKETYTDDEGRTKTRMVTCYGSDEIASGEKDGGFYLRDETGAVWVDPQGAPIETTCLFSEEASRGDALYYSKGSRRAVEGSTGERTFEEYGLLVGTPLFVRGRASERRDVVAAQIKPAAKTDIFIITTRTAKAVSAEWREAARFWGVVGALPPLGLGGMLVMMAGYGSSRWLYPLAVLPVALYLLLYSGGWAWMAFNSLIGLRQRVYQASSLIDVQLMRRADLIRRFVACVQGFREHEASVQTLLAAARAQVGGDPLKALAPGILAVIESYPEIRAQGLFNDLSKQLIETEDRIALARGYHNNIATFYNTRLERIPDSYLANFVKMKPEPLFEAEGFTYHPSAVAF